MITGQHNALYILSVKTCGEIFPREKSACRRKNFSTDGTLFLLTIVTKHVDVQFPYTVDPLDWVSQ